MSSINKGFYSLCIPLLTLLMFIGCENPGSVGGNFVDKTELTFDTLAISNIQPQSFIGYTGRMNFVSLGKYSDPVFGDIETSALLKPSINHSLPTGDSLDNDYSMKLELVIDSVNTYGDTLSASNFSVFEVTSDWNGATYKIDSELTYDESKLIGSFSLGDENSIIINLSNEWRSTYGRYFHNTDSDADSLYRYEFKGLVLVSRDGNNKISFPSINSSKFLAINEVDADTTELGIRDWAYSFNRSGEDYPSDVSPLHTTLEHMLHFNIGDFINDFQDENFVRAEIIFYEAADLLEENLPTNHNRLRVPSISLDVGYEEDPAYEFQFGAAESPGVKQNSDNSFRINITDYLNNSLYSNEDERDLYFGIGSNEGALRSTLVYNETATANVRPKLIITSLKDGEE